MGRLKATNGVQDQPRGDEPGSGPRFGRWLKGFVYGMRSGMVMLGMIAALSILGTVLPQGKAAGFYEQNYSGWTLWWIQRLHLDQVYSAWWFGLLILLLSVNLILCNLRRLPLLIRDWKAPQGAVGWMPERGVFHRVFSGMLVAQKPDGKGAKVDSGSENPLGLFFEKAGFRQPVMTQTEVGTFMEAHRHKAGLLGSWLSHLGLLLIIVFFFLGKVMGFEAFVYGVPGTNHAIVGTPYQLSIEDFDIEYRQDYSVYQYISDVTLTAPGTELKKSGRIQVNQPLRHQGMSIYQNGTGWVVEAVLEKEGQILASGLLYPGDVFQAEGSDLALQYLAFYPDFVLREGQPFTASPFLNRPALVFSLFYEGRQVRTSAAMPGEPIVFGDLTLKYFQPRLFTVLQVVRDPGTLPAALGGLLLLFGIFLSFYWVPQSLYGFMDPEGRGWISAVTKRNQLLFKEGLDELWKSVGMGGDHDHG